MIKMKYNQLMYIRLRVLLAVTMIMVVMPCQIGAFDQSVYAEQSVLSNGRWVKIKVSDTGMHLISTADLNKWGFTDPSRVVIRGYGGEPISDVMSLDNYIDDLPVTDSELTDRGLVFYARGPMKWSPDGTGSYDINYYSNEGYYFLTESDATIGREMKMSGIPGVIDATKCAVSFRDKMFHEKELVSAGATGSTLLGEDFRYTKSQAFNFNLPVKSDNFDVIYSFATKTIGSSSSVKLSVNGVEQSKSDIIPQSANDSHVHYMRKTFEHKNIAIDGGTQRLSVVLTYQSSVAASLARLDRMVVMFERDLSLLNGKLDFYVDSDGVILSGASEETRVWDVTDIKETTRVDADYSENKLAWTATKGCHHYVAWNPSAVFPSPEYVGEVANQNLHGREVPDMVIITKSEWLSQSEQLADLHRNSEDELDVMVVTDNDVFNEFSSGTPQINAFRRMLKMYWERGGGTPVQDGKLKYVLLMGRGSYDNRAITAEIKAQRQPTLIQWQTIDGSTDNISYTGDDPMAFLLDEAGAQMGSDYYCLAVGRIPVRSASEASLVVDKIRDYMADKNKSDWKNRVVIACDDQDNGVHLTQSEQAYSSMISTFAGRQYLYNKVYVDAFSIINKVAQGARDRMFRLLNQGVMWWFYIGHANTYSWTGEGLLTEQDIVELSLQHQPMLFAATCDFLKWDDMEQSGGERMFLNKRGLIAAVSATRPVLIANNITITLAVTRHMFDRDENGRPLAIGDIMRRAKNSVTGSETNKLRYVLAGDPALRLVTPKPVAVLDRINGEDILSSDQITIMARQEVEMEGRIVDSDGKVVNDFTGYIVPTLYDAEYSTTTQAHGGDNGEESTFEEQGDRLYVGRDSVVDGHFQLDISMPSEIASNFRPAALNIYAVANDGRDAMGVNRDFYIYGFDETVGADDEPPMIDVFGLNSETFNSGDGVNTTPMVLARVSDNKGINMSSAGVGHQISLVLDGERSFSDVAQYFSVGEDGAVSGSIYYQLPELADGKHSLRLRVWDTSNNMAESTIDFVVEAGQAPTIVDLYADANPAVDRTNFYVKHNRPGANVEITISVYDLLGRPVWTSVTAGKSDMFESMPVTWDLTDNAGRRVGRGIYVYRATISTDGEQYVSASRKLAVAPQ